MPSPNRAGCLETLSPNQLDSHHQTPCLTDLVIVLRLRLLLHPSGYLAWVRGSLVGQELRRPDALVVPQSY